MNFVQRWWVLGTVVLLVGCQPVTYKVKIINNSPFVTDFGIQSDDNTLPTFVQDVAANGGAVTVSHTGQGGLALVDNVTIVSGSLIGNQISPIDAQCETEVTANDLITVTKAVSGELTCVVTPGTLPRFGDVQRQVEQALGKEEPAKKPPARDGRR